MAIEENTVYPFNYFERTSAVPTFQTKERERERERERQRDRERDRERERQAERE